MPEWETAVPFVYPDETIAADLAQEINEYTDTVAAVKLHEAIVRLIYILEGKKNPQLFLRVLLKKYGLVSDTKSVLAQRMGLSRQAFQYQYKKAEMELLIALRDLKQGDKLV